MSFLLLPSQNYHKFGGLNNPNLLFYTSEGQSLIDLTELKSRCQQIKFVSRG